MNKEQLKHYLDLKVEKYNQIDFIDSDPIQIPHRFDKKEDIEIAGFLAATIAWGNRKMIIRNSNRMMDLMDNSPFDFIMNYEESDLLAFEGFVHRTFNSNDFIQFVKSLRNIYVNHGGIESVFTKHQGEHNMKEAIYQFKSVFFEIDHLQRNTKHISNPMKGSAAKRINMFLRWMVRKDNFGVDFGIWKNISPAKLSIPLDVHSGRIARELGMLLRKQNDWKAVAELDEQLRLLDPADPVKYDYALFGIGVFDDR
ncbi:MAG: TIGR02757 family protein [Flavobacteriales bacterium]|nr:TIGR02757 family protein [Flavobacteriales bacterium]